MLDPSEARLWAETVAHLIAGTENHLIRLIRDQIARDMGADTYQVTMLRDIAAVRARAEKLLGRDWKRVIQKVQAVLDDARTAGQGMAERDLEAYADRGPHHGFLPQQVDMAVSIIAADTMRHLTRLPALILRDTVDVYQQVMDQHVANAAMGAITRRRATEDALQEFARRGITSFTDRGGRRWRIDSYAEMATRTGAVNAMRVGYEHTLTAWGMDLVMVTGNEYTCGLCDPWEGKVLSLTGRYPAGAHMVEHTTVDGQMVTVHVAGTVQEASDAGLYHPNCTHSQSLYLPGVSRPWRASRPDPDTYRASQRQRALEVEIRRAKRELAAALTPETESVKRREIRALQARVRDLLAEHPRLQRQSYREQVRSAH